MAYMACRGCSYYFGYRAIRKFLDDNDLVCLIRAHQVNTYMRRYLHIANLLTYPHTYLQVQEEGFRRHFYSPDHVLLPSSPLTSENVKHMLPPVVTIFSAPNYCDRYGNKVWMYVHVCMYVCIYACMYANTYVTCNLLYSTRPDLHIHTYLPTYLPRPPSYASGCTPRSSPSSNSTVCLPPCWAAGRIRPGRT